MKVGSPGPESGAAEHFEKILKVASVAGLTPVIMMMSPRGTNHCEIIADVRLKLNNVTLAAVTMMRRGGARAHDKHYINGSLSETRLLLSNIRILIKCVITPQH